MLEEKKIDLSFVKVVQQLMDEYRAATRKDYINFGNVQAAQVNQFKLHIHRCLSFSSRLIEKSNQFILIIVCFLFFY